MNNKIGIAVLVILVGVVAFLGYQNYTLNKKVETIVAEKEAVSTAPVGETKPKDAEPSPFDNPNTDPLKGKSDNQPEPTTVKFNKIVHDFGRINEGEIVNTVFKFTNTGKALLLISDAQGSCGCTVPTWPRDPIAPGESGEIAVRFDSNGKKGENEKNVTVTCNTKPDKIVLTVKSTVIPKDK
ncbi:MAG TPA: DUF1573 domain-containing protein [Chitinophagales bacterium]|nr:DUF1573 domain-containing protein [Chitinophagales bacterium]